jgi:hypothetical protein
MPQLGVVWLYCQRALSSDVPSLHKTAAAAADAVRASWWRTIYIAAERCLTFKHHSFSQWCYEQHCIRPS